MAPKRSVVETVRSGNEGESSSGGRGTIVVKENPVWRGRKWDPQDAGQVETHLASRAPKGSARRSGDVVRGNFSVVSAASLKKLEKMHSVPGRTLLSSLKQVEVRNTVLNFPASECPVVI